MKRIVIFGLFILLLSGLFACNAKTQQKPPTSSTESVFSENIDVLYERDQNFEIYTNKENTVFHYYVRDDNGDVMDEGYHDYRGSFGFEKKDEILMLNYGAGGSSWQERYYDVTNGRTSRFFPNPLARSKEMIAYFRMDSATEEIKLVVQDIFEPSEYYREVARNFSSMVIKDRASAEFLEDNTKLKITYWTTPSDEAVTETIDLL